jgi:UrcA family protein
MTVKFVGLNLESADGAQAGLNRIRNSAAEFCSDTTGRVDLGRQQLIDGCKRTMTQKAVDQLHAPMVAALYEGRSIEGVDKTVAVAQR